MRHSQRSGSRYRKAQSREFLGLIGQASYIGRVRAGRRGGALAAADGWLQCESFTIDGSLATLPPLCGWLI